MYKFVLRNTPFADIEETLTTLANAQHLVAGVQADLLAEGFSILFALPQSRIFIKGFGPTTQVEEIFLVDLSTNARVNLA